jgi:O-methyltransferase
MGKLLKYCLSDEELLLPYYLSSHHFLSIRPLLTDLEPLPDHFNSQEVELFTTLNLSAGQIVALNPAAIRIPVYGWEGRADYFLTEGHFNIFHTKILEIMKSLPKVKFILEYQLNCFSLEGLKEFIEQLTLFRHKNPHSGGIELSFSLGNTPLYLDITLLEEKSEMWFKECLNEMQKEKENAFSQHEMTNLKNVQSETSSRATTNNYGKNAKKQILCTLYHSITFRNAKLKTAINFPRCLFLVKKAAEAFLEINPLTTKINASQRQEALAKYNGHLEEKIVRFKTESFPSSLNERQRETFLARFLAVKNHVLCEHSDLEMLEVAMAILRLPLLNQGVIVEAGVFKGGGTAKLSLVCTAAGRRLVAFDSFQGLPSHEEASPNVLYPPGVYFGGKDEVINNLKKYGDITTVDLVEGWFEETLPQFKQDVAIAYLDVDLVSSTTLCLRYLWPLLLSGGTIFCHDGHLPEVSKLIHDPEFWMHEFNGPVPKISQVFGQAGFIKIEKL